MVRNAGAYSEIDVDSGQEVKTSKVVGDILQEKRIALLAKKC